MKSIAEELEEIKQELLVLQKRIELVEEKGKLNEMKKEKTVEFKSSYSPINWYGKTSIKSASDGLTGDTIVFDNMNRSSFSDIN